MRAVVTPSGWGSASAAEVLEVERLEELSSRSLLLQAARGAERAGGGRPCRGAGRAAAR